MNSLSIKVSCSKADLKLCYEVWPENFSSLYEMGLRAFEKLFHHRPQLKTFFGLSETDNEWRTHPKLKKIVLTLEQSLVQAVAVFADPAPAEPIVSPAEFAVSLQEIGGFHRVVVPSVDPEHFIFLFKLLPEVICDVTSQFRSEGPLTSEERVRLLGVWQALSQLMSAHIISGWERRVIPGPSSKFYKLFRSAEQVAAHGLCADTSTPTTSTESTVTGGKATEGPSREKGRRGTEPYTSSNNGGPSDGSAQNVRPRGRSGDLSFDDIEAIHVAISNFNFENEKNKKK